MRHPFAPRDKLPRALCIGATAAAIVAAAPSPARAAGDTWTEATAAAPWAMRSGATALDFDGKLWLLGGSYQIGENPRVNHNDVWHTTDGAEWTQATAAAAWTPRNNHASVVFDGRMWVIGGDTGVDFNNEVWTSTDGVAWQQQPAAPWDGRIGLSATVFDGRILVTGGLSVDGVSHILYNDVWTTQDGQTWTQLPDAPFDGRFTHSATVFGGALYIIGGAKVVAGSNEILGDIWRTTDGTTWTQVTADAPFIHRAGHRAIVYDGALWITGGTWLSPEEEFLNDVWRTSDGTAWIEVTAAAQWPSRRLHAMAVYDGRMWILGGVRRETPATEYQYLRDVWYSPEPTAVISWESYF